MSYLNSPGKNNLERQKEMCARNVCVAEGHEQVT